MTKQQFKIEKAPAELLNSKRNNQRNSYPLTEMKVGEMFKTNTKEKTSVYNAIKHRRNYTKELGNKKFTIKAIPNNMIAVIRIK